MSFHSVSYLKTVLSSQKTGKSIGGFPTGLRYTLFCFSIVLLAIFPMQTRRESHRHENNNKLLGNQKKEMIKPEFLSQTKINEFNKYFATIGFEAQKSQKIEFIKQSEKIKYNFEPFFSTGK